MAIDERWVAEALAAAERISEAQATVERARSDYQRAVRAIYVEGASMREIADRLGISHQRVHQLLDLPRQEGPVRRLRRGRRGPLACSFCGRDQTDVGKLVAGPRVFICDGCVALARGLVLDQSSASVAENATVQMRRSTDTRRCSFCGKRNTSRTGAGVDLPIVTGDAGFSACRDCLDLSQKIIDGDG